MCWRTASSVAMLSALVTTVTAGEAEPAFRSARVASARATSVVVVPPLSPAIWPVRTSPAAAAAMRCFSVGMPLGLVPQRQVVGDALGHGAAPDPGEHLLTG